VSKTPLEQLAEKVVAMRANQVAFFRTKSKIILKTCKEQEREVDALCKSILQERSFL
jgi:hypothetical protein